MVKQDRYYGVDRYLPHAVVATTAVVAIPMMVVVALLVALDGELAPLLAAVVGAALALIVAGIGSLLWSNSSGSLDVAFSELLIWGWVRRKRAEERAARNAKLLGLDNDGRPAKRARSARDQQLAILGDLSSALESKDPYTHGHSQRVERHAVRTAAQLGMSVEQLAELRRAAALHDVGKIRVPHRILRKPGSLTPEERRVIEQHTVVGAWLVSSVCKKDIVLAVRHHHERWDGRGYPDGLSGEQIPLYARVIAVADAFDAMTSSRPYRVAYDSRTAIEILEAEAGAQFDPTVVRAFVETVPSQVPIAALLPFFGAGLFRKLAGNVRRVLNGTAMSGAAAAGAASILIATLMSPIEAPLAQPDLHDDAPAQVLVGPATPGNVLGGLTADASDVDLKADAKSGNPKLELRKKADRQERDARKAAKRTNKRDGRKRNPETIVLSDHIERDTSSGSTPTNPGGPGAGSTTPAPAPQPATNGDPAPAADHGSGNGHTPPGDPQPTRGRDCPAQGPGGAAPGRIKHCG